MPKATSPDATEPSYQKAKERDARRPFISVLQEHDLFTQQQSSRRAKLKEIEELTGSNSATIAFICSDEFGGSVDPRDIAAFGDVLMSVGDVKTLNLIIDSPGGDGPTAEKLIELCRAYCKTFRVLIPNKAKSAATIIALGANEIVMGHCSELGPIDAQVPIIVANVPRWISAQSFIDAKESLQQEFADRLSKDPKADVRDILQQLASMNGPFIDHCRKLMDFSRDVAKKNLEKHMFSAMPAAKRQKAIERVIDKLSRPTDNFQIHSRMINGHTAKTVLGLNVKLLPKDSDLWAAIWQYYIRADAFLAGRHGMPSAKLVESRCESLFMGPGVQ